MDDALTFAIIAFPSIVLGMLFLLAVLLFGRELRHSWRTGQVRVGNLSIPRSGLPGEAIWFWVHVGQYGLGFVLSALMTGAYAVALVRMLLGET